MQRQRVVDFTSNAAILQELSQSIAPAGADAVLVVDHKMSFCDLRGADVRSKIAQRFVIKPGVGSPSFGPGIQMFEFYEQDRRLQRIQPAVQADDLMKIFGFT